jgi:quinol monooxygenase YgiN
MQFVLRSVLALAACAALAATVRAQAPAPPPPPDGPRYVVTYIEVYPTEAAQAVKLVRQFRDAIRKEPGNLRAVALQRIGQANQFVLLEAWKDQAAADGHFKTAATVQFRDKIKSIQNAPIDERVHFPLSVGEAFNSGLVLERKVIGRRDGPFGPSFTVTPVPTWWKARIAVVVHVDVIPPQRENGTAIIKQLAEDSRKEKGNMHFEAVTQVNRQNHFTVIEVWHDRKAADAHSMAVHTRAFRDKLAPASGALYDERFYLFLGGVEGP